MAKDVRLNVLLLALLAALLIVGLVFFGASDGVMALASALVGAIGAVMLRLTEPEPNPMVSAEALHMVLNTPVESAPVGAPVRFNIIFLALIGGMVVFGIALVGGASAAAVNIAGIMVGGIATVMSKLVDPEEPAIPASVVKDVLAARAEADKLASAT